MTHDDFVYGSRSGIQKAVRRGDLDLGKTSFDALWGDVKQRSWLRWRVTSILQEDSLAMVGELPDHFDLIKTLAKDSDEERAAWRTLLFRSIVCPAQQDAHGLIKLSRLSDYTFEHPELDTAREFTALLSDNSPHEAAIKTAEWARGFRKLSAYESRAVDVLVKRASMGGMVGDQITPIAAIIVLAYRPLSRKEWKVKVKEGADKWTKRVGRSTPASITLPWYVFDMHTQVGKIAKSAVARKIGMDKEWLGRVWFLCESAFVPKEHTTYSAPVASPTVWQTIWWPQWLSYALKTGDHDAKTTLAEWREKRRESVRGMVEYLLRVREKDQSKR